MAMHEFYFNLAQLVVTIALSMVAGIALAMYVWIIPIVHMAPSTAAKIQQFNYNITLGARYQQQGSRVIVLILFVLACISYNHNNALLQQRWKYNCAAIALLVPTAPYEIYAIFPANDKLRGWAAKLKQDALNNFGDGRDAQVDAVLESWRRWHLIRFLAPFTGTCILVWGSLVT